MSTATIDPPFGFDVLAGSSRASGASLYDWMLGLRPSESLASEQARRDRIDALLDLDPRYQEANWNGEGADPIPAVAFEEADKFLCKLPHDLPLPEVIAEPDGYLGLEWYANKRLLYVVSFNGQGAYSCSGLIGQTKVSGTYYIDDGIPSEILRIISRIIR
jgi:hypothetical protein